MAYTVIKTEQGANAGNGYYTEYLCESVDDIATLPTEVENGGPRPGSLALLEDGTVYLLKNNREWSEFSMAGGGGSTGGGYDAIIRLDTQDTGSTWTGTVESGTFEAIQAKAEAGEMFTLGAYWRNQDENWMSVGDVGNLWYTNYVPAPLTGQLGFHIYMEASTTGTLNDYDLVCSWESDGTITIEAN